MDAASIATGAISLKPNKPESYGGTRDYLVVNTWIYKVEQYLILIQLSNPAAPLTDANRMIYASKFLTGTAAVSWYTLVHTHQAPATWEDFRAAVAAEFVPHDHVRRARDKLRKLKQTTSVAKFLSDFRNIVLTIPDISDGEKWDKFCAGLKYDVRLEVLKSAATTFEHAAKIALRVDSAIWASLRPRAFGVHVGVGSSSDAPTTMEIGNMERGRGRMEGQRLTDYQKNACFKFHKDRCRPWKHDQKKSAANNMGVETLKNEVSEGHYAELSSDSEN